MEPIIASLDDLANLQDLLVSIELRYQAEREAIIAPVREALEDVDQQLIDATSELRFKIGAMEESIKYQVVDLGKSVKGSSLHAVYSKPRVTWDSKGLDGFAVAHPEMEAFRKVGQPSVSIRSAK